MFKKNQRVVKVIDIQGSKTATIQTIASVKKGVVRCVDSCLDYDAKTGEEIGGVLPGCTSELIPLEDE